MELPPPPPLPVGEPPPTRRGRGPQVGLLVFLGLLLVVALVAAAVVVSRVGSDGSLGVGDGPTVPAAPGVDAPGAPRSVRAATASFKVVVTWAPSSGEVAGYRIYRDGHVLDEVGADVGRYVDDTVAPNSRYRYQVAAFTEAGTMTERTDVSVKTPPAPLALARVQGTFNATLHRTSSFGVTFAGDGGPGTLGLALAPVCGEGACDVTLSVTGEKIERFRLNRTAARYAGAGTDRAAFTCGGTPTNASFDVRFSVTSAKPLKGVWRASTLKGTILVRSAAQLGCMASGIDYAFTAKLYPA